MTDTVSTPGYVLRTKVLSDMKVSQEELAQALGVSRFTVNQILNSRRAVTPEMALRLAQVLDTSAELWLKLQNEVDLAEARNKLADELASLPKLREASASNHTVQS